MLCHASWGAEVVVTAADDRGHQDATAWAGFPVAMRPKSDGLPLRHLPHEARPGELGALLGEPLLLAGKASYIRSQPFLRLPRHGAWPNGDS
jgi:hypothetical protein